MGYEVVGSGGGGGTCRALREELPWVYTWEGENGGLDGKELGFGDWQNLSSNPGSTLTPLMAGVGEVV